MMPSQVLKLSLILIFALSSKSFAFDLSGLQISLSGDIIYDQGLNSKSEAAEKLTVRGAEMTFYAPLDHRFEGLLSAAAHDENGELNFELHELYLKTTKLIPRGSLKVGQFFLGVGRLNRIHQHDWPFTNAPKVQVEFFDAEGVFDTGAEFTYLLPTEFYLDLTLGVTSGYRYGHAHTAGSKPDVPTHYARLATFKEIGSINGILFSLNYLGRTDEQKNQMQLFGTELVAKVREGKRLVYMFQSEAWYRVTKNPMDSTSEQAGAYIFNQYGFNEELLLGLRLDFFKDFSLRNAITQKKINNVDYGTALELTWKSSEFVYIRPGFSHLFSREEGRTITQDTRFEVQFVFILGAHPAHSF